MSIKNIEAVLAAASRAAVNDRLNSRIDIEYRMKTVYTPTVLQNVVCQLFKDITSSYAQLKKSSTKKFCREAKEVCAEYMKANHQAMGDHVFSTVIEKSNAFHSRIYQHLLIHQLGYDGILLNIDTKSNSSELMTVSMAYVCKVILEYIMRYDRKANEVYAKALWDVAPNFQHQDNPHTKKMYSLIIGLLDMYGFSRNIGNESTNMSMAIFDKSVKELVEMKIVNELLDAE